MPKSTASEFMITFVQEYLDKKSDRLSFDLDFNHYLIQYYPKMERENPDLAECFNFYLAEEGFDQANGLSDVKHRELIRRQLKKFKSAMQDGFA